MKLSELRQKTPSVLADAEGEPGSLHNVVAYQRGISALRNGQPVTLIACGDITGMSPAEKFVDENGRIDWAPSDEFVVDDRNVIPLSADQRARLSGQVSSRR